MKLKEMWNKILKGNRKIYSSEICLWLYLKKGFSGGSDGKDEQTLKCPSLFKISGKRMLMISRQCCHIPLCRFCFAERLPGGLSCLEGARFYNSRKVTYVDPPWP